MTMPPRLTVVNDIERIDHYHLPADARCYFWGDYTPHEHTNGLRWRYSPTNQLIANFKKKMDRAGQSDWHYKIEATVTIANAFSQFWRWQELLQTHRVTLIPIPPSKPRNDPMYDPRMYDMLVEMASRTGLPLDIRDCLSFNGQFDASHESDNRPTPDDLYATLAFDAAAGRPQQQPGVIYLFDDMLTTGAHYVAAVRRLGEFFPDIQIVGNFISRRVVPNPFADSDAL